MGSYYITALSNQEVSMTTMTIRGLDDSIIKAIKEKAKKEGKSVNATLVNIIQEELGFGKKARTRIYTDLDHLAGTWTEKEYKDFLKKVEDFEKIDENLWK